MAISKIFFILESFEVRALQKELCGVAEFRILVVVSLY